MLCPPFRLFSLLFVFICPKLLKVWSPGGLGGEGRRGLVGGMRDGGGRVWEGMGLVRVMGWMAERVVEGFVKGCGGGGVCGREELIPSALFYLLLSSFVTCVEERV